MGFQTKSEPARGATTTMTRSSLLCFLVVTFMLAVTMGMTSVSAAENVAEEKIVHVKQNHQKSPSEENEIVGDDSNLVFAPECEPKCKSSEFCNFAGQCEPYPILIMECEVGSSCDRCHCSGSCVEGVCQPK